MIRGREVCLAVEEGYTKNRAGVRKAALSVQTLTFPQGRASDDSSADL